MYSLITGKLVLFRVVVVGLAGGKCHQGSIIYKQPPFVSHTHQDSSLPSSCAFIKCFPTAKLKKTILDTLNL